MYAIVPLNVKATSLNCSLRVFTYNYSTFKPNNMYTCQHLQLVPYTYDSPSQIITVTTVWNTKETDDKYFQKVIMHIFLIWFADNFSGFAHAWLILKETSLNTFQKLILISCRWTTSTKIQIDLVIDSVFGSTPIHHFY